MSLGLLGGTFDPIHLGHLRAAENAREALGLSRVLLMPAAVPPHRPPAQASALDRWAMTALACAGHPSLVASDLELLRSGPSYTVDTVEALRAQDPEVVLIVGADAYAELPGWKDSARLRTRCTVAVVGRPGGGPPAGDEEGVRWIPSSELAISGTALRQRLREGGSVRFLVPDMVADYIEKRGLYR